MSYLRDSIADQDAPFISCIRVAVRAIRRRPSKYETSGFINRFVVSCDEHFSLFIRADEHLFEKTGKEGSFDEGADGPDCTASVVDEESLEGRVRAKWT